MSLTVAIGLESLAKDRADIERFLISLVEKNATTCVRHTFPRHADLATAKDAVIIEAVHRPPRRDA